MRKTFLILCMFNSSAGVLSYCRTPDELGDMLMCNLVEWFVRININMTSLPIFLLAGGRNYIIVRLLLFIRERTK